MGPMRHGTNEAWEMTMGVNTDGTAYSCTVGTPRGTTYLYFENFEIEVSGATVEHTGRKILCFLNSQTLL